ncbi:MAG: PEGA domain-containing protein [Methanoregulaceae archaeon]|nr:PEGA domain-containing protein [Methanoregulaceae archaeon]
MKVVSWLLLIFLIGTVVWSCAGEDIPANATGYLQVSSVPPGAAVYLDAVYKGITPETTGFINITDLEPREYSLVLKKPGYMDYISTVKIVSGQTVKVTANLKSANGNAQEDTGNPAVTGVIVVIIVLVLVGFVVLFMRSRRKPKEPKKIELD